MPYFVNTVAFIYLVFSVFEGFFLNYILCNSLLSAGELVNTVLFCGLFGSKALEF